MEHADDCCGSASSTVEQTQASPTAASRWKGAARWRVVGLGRKLKWLYRGVRWRVVGLGRKLKWLYRGVRWRVVGLGRKLKWLYRGVRWRVVSRWRKFLWFGRRRRADLRSLVTRTRARTRALPGLNVLDADGRRAARATIAASIRDHGSRQPFEELMEYYGVASPPARHRLRRALTLARRRRRLFGHLRPPADATRQVVRFDRHDRRDRAVWGKISSARIVEVGTVERADVFDLLLPTMCSCRPVVFSEPPDWLPASAILTVDALEDLRAANEHELAHRALAQVRALLLAALAPPTVSIVMSTNRADLVDAAVEQMSRQVGARLEVLVGLHGVDPAAVRPAPHGALDSIEVSEFSSETVFGDVLADLSARAGSAWVLKWDDDDLYGRHHVLDLWIAAVLSGSDLVGKAAEFVLLDDDGLLVRRRGGPINRISSYLAGGTLFVARERLLAVGNWASIPRSVDQDLIRRLERIGSPPFRTHGYEFVLVRHGRGHTWSAGSEYFLSAANWIRDRAVVAETGVFEGPAAPRSQVEERPVRLSVCVPNRDGHAAMRVLEAASTARDVEVVVADDRSSPPLEFAAPLADRVVVRVDPGAGFGAGRSRHVAALRASGDVLLFVDADIVVSDEMMRRIDSCYRRGFDGVLSSPIRFSDIDVVDVVEALDRSTEAAERLLAARSQPGQGWRERYWAASADLVEPVGSTYRQVVGGLLAVTAELYETTGGFRDVPIRGVEDTEFGYRLQLVGAEQRLLTAGGVWHVGQRTFSDTAPTLHAEGREEVLAAHVPIWARSIAERRQMLDDYSGAISPFVEIGDVDARREAVGVHGTTMVAEAGTSTSFLDSPYATALDVSPRHAGRAVEVAYRCFRERRAGECLVRLDGEVVGRFAAIWALNRARRSLGRPPVMSARACDDAEISALRRLTGLAVLELE